MGMSLVFDGDIELMSEVAEDEGYSFEALSTTRRGNPVPVEVTLASFLRDGSIVSKTGDENREMVIPVRVTGADLLVLALGEKRLNLATGKASTLVWTPHDGIAPATVFDVLTSSLEEPQDGDWDLAELRNQRTYNLRLVCLPFGRSVDATTDDSATPPAAAGTVVNPLDAATGWTSAYGATAPAVDTSIKTQGTGSVRTTSGPAPTWLIETFTPGGFRYTVTQGVDTWVLSQAVTSGEWTSIKCRFEWTAPTEAGTSGFTSMKQTIGGVQSSITAQVSAPDANGFITYSWRQGASGTITALQFGWQQYQAGWQSDSGGVPYASPHVWYDALTTTPAGAGGKQIVKTFEVGGSARAPGSLHIAAPTDLDALGQVFAATMPSSEVATGFTPDVVRWVTSGTTSADATSLHGVTYAPGATYGAAGSMVAAVPVSILTPGPYHVYALVKYAADPLVLGVEAQLMANGSTASGPALTVEVTVPNPVASAWRFVPVGTLDLPPVEMVNPGSSASVRLRTKGACVIGELLLIPASGQGRTGADVTIVDCGTGTVSASAASSHLWLESPTAARRYGGVFRGPTADGLNRRAASFDDLKKPGVHYWTPGQMTSYVISAGVAGTNVTLTHTAHWFGNAAS